MSKIFFFRTSSLFISYNWSCIYSGISGGNVWTTPSFL